MKASSIAQINLCRKEWQGQCPLTTSLLASHTRYNARLFPGNQADVFWIAENITTPKNCVVALTRAEMQSYNCSNQQDIKRLPSLNCVVFTKNAAGFIIFRPCSFDVLPDIECQPSKFSANKKSNQIFIVLAATSHRHEWRGPSPRLSALTTYRNVAPLATLSPF